MRVALRHAPLRSLPAFVAASLCVLGSLFAAAAGAATWTYVNLSPYANWRLQDQAGLSGVPTGISTFTGIPFQLPATGPSSWDADLAAGANPRVLDVPVSVRSVQSVHLLLNSIWGQPSGSYCSIVVSDSAGVVDSLALTGNQHLRDYNVGPWTSTINGTTTVQGWGDGTCGLNSKHLDVFTLTLPPEWTGRRVTRIRVIDNGASNFQRALVSGITLETADGQAHVSLNLPGMWNGTWKNTAGMASSPSGTFVLAGVPFDTPGAGNDCWDASVAGTDPVVLTVPVKRRGIRTLHTLINTLWGQAGPVSYATISCFYEGGQRVDVPLVGGVDVRDYNVNNWTNTINGTTTVSVWNNGECAFNTGHRLDMQSIALPAQFLATRLDSIRFVDTGATAPQRMVLHGLTLDVDSLYTAGVEPHAGAAGALLQVFPNPAGASFRLSLGSRADAGPVTIDVVDVRGRRVGRQVAVPAGTRDVEIGPRALGSAFAPGVYFVRVQGRESSARARVVVLP